MIILRSNKTGREFYRVNVSIKTGGYREYWNFNNRYKSLNEDARPV